MLQVTVELEGGAKVTAPFPPSFKLREEVEFERYFGLSSTVLQRYADRANRIDEWRAEHPEPPDKAPPAAKRAWTEAAAAFEDQLRDQAPPQEHMLFVVWLRARKVDPVTVPADFDAFLDVVERLVYDDPEAEAAAEAAQAEASANGNGHAPAKRPRGRPRKNPEPAAGAGDPTAPVAPSSS